jgi:hypothetical protein
MKHSFELTTGPLEEYRIWLAAACRARQRRDDPEFARDEHADEPCGKVGVGPERERYDDACWFTWGHSGRHSWQVPWPEIA